MPWTPARRALQGENDKRLVACVKLRPGAKPGWKPRGYLAQRLAGYMVPSIFVFVDEFPSARPARSTGANFRSADDAARLEHGYVAARPIEQELARIWAEVLHVEKVGVEDNF